MRRGPSGPRIFSIGANMQAALVSMLHLDSAQISDCGRVRNHNEDSIGSFTPESEIESRTRGWLFALADGVGGQDAGEVASRTAVEALLEGFRAAPAGEPHSALLRRLIQSANTRIYEAGHSGAKRVAMATTLVACSLRFNRAAVAHVGDSRCYLIRGGAAESLTRDHTVVNDQMRLGVLSAKEASESAAKHVLSRSLGNDMFVSVEIAEHQVLAGDVLLLCSDGLHGPVPEHDLAEIVRRHQDLNEAARRLVEVANERDGGDNVSIQLVRVHSVERIGMYRGRPYKLA